MDIDIDDEDYIYIYIYIYIFGYEVSGASRVAQDVGTHVTPSWAPETLCERNSENATEPYCNIDPKST